MDLIRNKNCPRSHRHERGYPPSQTLPQGAEPPIPPKGAKQYNRDHSAARIGEQAPRCALADERTPASLARAASNYRPGAERRACIPPNFIDQTFRTLQ